MAQRMMGAMPGVGHGPAAAAVVLASACFIHKAGLGGALDSETTTGAFGLVSAQTAVVLVCSWAWRGTWRCTGWLLWRG
jgi:hypothetical protein